MDLDKGFDNCLDALVVVDTSKDAEDRLISLMVALCRSVEDLSGKLDCLHVDIAVARAHQVCDRS